jgi:predicted nucleic acid-binding protein
MAKLQYLLDLDVLVELTRPNGNRRVFTLFQQRQALCGLAAPTLLVLLSGIDALADAQRRQQLKAFATELLESGPPVLPFDREAALWLSRARPGVAGFSVHSVAAQVAAIATVHDLQLVTHDTRAYAGLGGLRLDDWFRP